MKRRAFLGLFGGAAVAGPKVVAEAAKVTTADLHFDALQVATGSSPESTDDWYEPADDAAYKRSRVNHAKKALKKLLGMSEEKKRKELRDFQVYALDPGTASLRSMSLDSKIRRQRRISYHRGVALHEERLRDVISGFIWD